MTIDETKDELYRLLSDCVNNSYPIRNNTQKGKYRNAVKTAIASLEAWDKVRAEIEELEIVYESYFADDTRTDAQKCADWWKMDKQIVLQIIDKHLQEVTE